MRVDTPGQFKGEIYKATNTVNGKMYIGQTIQGLGIRKWRHFQDTKRGSNIVFHKAIRKYGEDNFEFEVIDTASSEDELTNKENYWIETLKTYIEEEDSQGYNMVCYKDNKRVAYGVPTKITEDVYLEIIRKCAKGNYSIDNLVREYEVSKTIGYYIFNEDSYISVRFRHLVSDSLFIEARTNFKELNYKRAMSKLSNHKRKENHHYWGLPPGDHPMAKPVIQIDKDTGEVLREFTSATEAGQLVNAHHVTAIARVCRGERKSSYGYIWRYASPIRYKNKKKEKGKLNELAKRQSLQIR